VFFGFHATPWVVAPVSGELERPFSCPIEAFNVLSRSRPRLAAANL